MRKGGAHAGVVTVWSPTPMVRVAGPRAAVFVGVPHVARHPVRWGRLA